MFDRQRDEDKCRRKTAKGNAFVTEQEARAAAKLIEAGSPRFVTHFKCTVCSKWHIGSRGFKPEFADVPVEYELVHHAPVKIGTSLGDVLKEYRQ